MDVQPQLIRNSVYVPIRFVSESLGATVQWNNPNIVIQKGDTTVTCSVNSSVYIGNGQKFSTKERAYLSHNRVFVPLRIIGELLNCEVKYSKIEENKSVHLLELQQINGRKIPVTVKKLIKKSKYLLMEIGEF